MGGIQATRVNGLSKEERTGANNTRTKRATGPRGASESEPEHVPITRQGLQDRGIMAAPQMMSVGSVFTVRRGFQKSLMRTVFAR